MAVELQVFDDSFEAAADLRTKQFYLVKLDANRKVVLASAATDNIIGVLQNKPNTGQSAKVRLIGISKVVAGAAFTLATNTWLTSDANGKAVAAAPAAGTNNGVVGQPYESATAADDIVTALVNAPNEIQG